MLQRAPSPARLPGDAWGIAALVAVVFALACREAIAPGRDPRCVYPGDTIGVLRKGANGIVSECVWITADAQACWTTPVRHAPPVCVVGGSMNPGRG